MNFLQMANLSLCTQLCLLCFYSSFTFVYQSHVFRMVTSVPCQQTDFIVFYLTGNKSNSFLVFLSKIENWCWGSLGCVIPLTPFLPFFASQFLSRGFCSFEAQTFGVFSSAPARGHHGGAGKFVCTCLFSSI